MSALIAAALLALAAPEPVALPVTVDDGAAWTIDARRVREDERKDGARKVESHSRYRAVYRKAGDGGRLTLTPAGGAFVGELPPGFKLEAFEFPLELEVDESLTPVRLVNWPRVREALYRVMGEQDPKVVEAMRGIFDKLPDEQAGAMFLPQLAFLGLGQGLALEPGKPFTYDDSLPNPLGGPPIKAKAAFTLESRDAARGETVVVWTQEMDEESMAESIRVMLKTMMARMASPADAAKLEAQMREMSVSRSARCRFAIDDASGLARQADCASTIEVKAPTEAGRRVDTWTITQTLPEAR